MDFDKRTVGLLLQVGGVCLLVISLTSNVMGLEGRLESWGQVASTCIGAVLAIIGWVIYSGILEPKGGEEEAIAADEERAGDES